MFAYFVISAHTLWFMLAVSGGKSPVVHIASCNNSAQRTTNVQIECLHGITFGAMWSACTAYALEIAPRRYEASRFACVRVVVVVVLVFFIVVCACVSLGLSSPCATALQGLLNGLYWGLGCGVGGVVGGLVYEQVGGARLFLYASLVNVGIGVAYAVVLLGQRWLARK